ncbi:Uncharacterised protein [Vibrio cholerae]|nr:Uncharacterised protein [Vibrio cholerae]
MTKHFPMHKGGEVFHVVTEAKIKIIMQTHYGATDSVHHRFSR